MKVKLYGTEENTAPLLTLIQQNLEELGLVDFIQVEVTQDTALKDEMKITEEPALIIEEESIDFKDVIFQGMVPSSDEIKSMFISIIGGGSTGGSCGSKEDDGSCGT